MFVSQDLDRAHREVNGLKSTVSAQGKEVERLQRENATLRSEMETHKLTVCFTSLSLLYSYSHSSTAVYGRKSFELYNCTELTLRSNSNHLLLAY